MLLELNFRGSLLTALIIVTCGLLQAQNPLFIPDTLGGSVFDLQLQTGSVQFLPGDATITMGANGPLLGPTLIMVDGEVVTINVENQLGEPTTIHWHGMHVAPENDGGPHTPIAPGETWSPSFTVIEKASTHWYHPHLHMLTNDHMIKGIAGLIIVRDGEEATLDLPRTYGVDDLPLMVQTKEFDTNNQLVIGGAGDSHVTVNGTLDPFVEVPAQVVRLRLLNGASERAFNFGFTNNMQFHQIASDGGLLTSPVPSTRVRLAPGERAEVLLDLAGMQGQGIHLINYGIEMPNAIYGAAQPGMGPGQTIPGYAQNPLNGNNFNMLRLDIGTPTADPVTTIPGVMTTHDPWQEADADITRTFNFSPVTMGPNAIQGPFLINNMPFDMMLINFDVPFENIEIWQLTNQSPIAHPFHIHDVQFYILDINGAPPPPHLQGRKDVVLVPAGGGVVRFITRFEDHWNEEIPYMYHCHMLTHEDDGMMGQFRVLPPANIGINDLPQQVQIRIIPNPATDHIELLIGDAGAGMVMISDGFGRIIMETSVNADRSRIDVSGSAPGIYIARYRSNSGIFNVRFVKQ